MKSIFKVYCIALFFLVCSEVNSQTLINELWELKTNYPDTVEWSASTLSSSNLYTTGNTWHNATQKTNIVTTKTNSSGTVIWQTEYNGTLSGFDYGSAICLDGSGNVFVAGATHNTSAYTFDIVIIKYNSSGTQQWATLYNGSGSNMDIPSGITLDGSGNIYVCGASIGSTTGYDYVTINLNSSGTQQWAARYDYTSLYDIPGYIAWNSSTSKIGIAGASQSSATNWDYTTIKYNSSGTLTNTNRTSTAGYGFDRPTGLVTDASDNYYITGYAYNGTNYDIRTIKLDDELSPIWTVTKNGGYEDGANGIAIDGSNNTYVCGFQKNSLNKKQIVIIKYNSSGTQQWVQTLSNRSNSLDGEGVGITYNSSNSKVIVTGYYTYPSGVKVITTFALNTSNGTLSWTKDFPNLNASIDIPTKVHSSGDNVWVVGRRTEDDTTRYITAKYEIWEKEWNPVDSDTVSVFLADELLIRFIPPIVNTSFVDNRNQEYELLENVIPDSIYDQISPFLTCGSLQYQPMAIKVYRKLQTKDSLSISRLGDTVRVARLWSTFRVTVSDTANVFSIIDTLRSNKYIMHVEVNPIYHFASVPDDYFFDLQQSLDNTDVAEADINSEPAWDIEVGQPFVKVGIYDSGIKWKHEDFHEVEGDESFETSKIIDGWDYFNNWHVSINDPGVVGAVTNFHGTCVAGIVGAIRNNEIGVAGVAGGDLSDDNRGVSLYDFTMIPPGNVDEPLLGSFVAEAILDGALDLVDGDFGYALNLTNNSYGEWNPTGYEGLSNYVVSESILEMFKNNVTFVASKGNQGSGLAVYPVDFSDEKIISVGGANILGQHHPAANHNNVDVIAPYATNADIFTTTSTTVDSYTASFGGTSAAAAFVTGVAALMMSEANNPTGEPDIINLSPEDVETIITLTADDRTLDPCSAGEDDYCGFGMLDAYEAVQKVEPPYYQVLHFSGHPTYTSVFGPFTISMPPYELPWGEVVYGGVYHAYQVYEESDISHTISPTATVLGYWVRNSASTNYSFSTGLTHKPNVTISEFDESHALLYGYKWNIFEDQFGNPIGPYLIPTEYGKFSYSVWIYDPEAVEINSIATDINNVTVYPNPASNQIVVELPDCSSEVEITIFSFDGKTIIRSLHKDCNNENITLDINQLAPSIYMLQIKTENNIYNAKFVKTNNN